MLMNRGARRARVLVSLPASLALATGAAAATALDEIVVTASRMHAPLTVVTDPKAPRQPLPAHDGADYLKTIPGFSVIRKGGTDGRPGVPRHGRLARQHPARRRAGAWRLRHAHGSAHRLRVPGSLRPHRGREGPADGAARARQLAASVSFERDVERFEQRDYVAHASALGASAGRNDLVGDLRLGNASVYGQLTGTRAEADDYEDGAGNRVHSAYERWSTSGALGWTPTPTRGRTDGNCE